MKQLPKIRLFFSLLVFITLISCGKNDVKNLSLSKSTLTLNVGQSDSVIATITLSGDISEQSMSFTHSTPDIVSIKESDKQSFSQASGKNSVVKTIVFKGLKTGTTTITLKAGDRTTICEITVNPSNYNFTQASSANWGDYYDTETNSFDLYLFESSFTLNNGKLNGNGSYLYFDLSVPLTQDGLIEGTYTAWNEPGKVNTFYPGEQSESQFYGTRMITINGNDTTVTLINDGQFTITINGGNYKIEGDLTTENNASVHFIYNGTLPVNDLRDPIDIKPTFTKGELIYLGDPYNVKVSHSFIVYLATANVNFETLSLKTGDEILTLQLNANLTAFDSIPSGSYSTTNKLTEATDFAPFSLVFGFNNDKGQDLGCWYYGETINKLKTGKAVVSKTGNQYTINYSLYDRFGSKVSGTFTGPLTYIDGTKPAASGVAAARVKSHNAAKSFPVMQKKITTIKPGIFKR